MHLYDTLPHNLEESAQIVGDAIRGATVNAILLRHDGKLAAKGKGVLVFGSRAGTFWPFGQLIDECQEGEVKTINLGGTLIVEVAKFRRCNVGREHYHFLLP